MTNLQLLLYISETVLHSRRRLRTCLSEALQSLLFCDLVPEFATWGVNARRAIGAKGPGVSTLRQLVLLIISPLRRVTVSLSIRSSVFAARSSISVVFSLAFPFTNSS